MLDYSRFVKKRISSYVRALLLVLPVLTIVLSLSQVVFAKNTYLINDGGKVTIHSTYSTDPQTVLQEVGVNVGENDIVTTLPGDGMSEITVQRLQTITLINGSTKLTLSSYGETVDSLIARSNLILANHDVLSVPMDSITYDGMEITVSQSTKRTETYYSPISYKTIYCYDDSLPEGEELVLIQGKDGQILYTTDVFYLDGKEIRREIVSEVVSVQPTDCLIAIGTKVESTEPAPMPTEPKPTKPIVSTPAIPAPSEPEQPLLPPSNIPSGEQGMPVVEGNTIITPTGEVLTFSKRLDCKATAYSCNGVPGITYTGTPARVGAIAVDPKVIPLGSTLYIYTNDGAYIYGVATAEDIGGAIKGNIVDLYFNSFDECWIFGVRECSVFILD